MVETIIPTHLLGSENQEAFLLWLRGLPLDPEDKKRILRIWCDDFGVQMTREMVTKAGAR